MAVWCHLALLIAVLAAGMYVSSCLLSNDRGITIKVPCMYAGILVGLKYKIGDTMTVYNHTVCTASFESDENEKACILSD